MFWTIGKGVLWLLDGFFSIIDKIWRYQFFNNEYVNKIFSGAIIVACSWLILKVVIELIMNYIVKSDNRGSPLSIYRGVILAITMMFLIGPLYDFGHNISTALTEDVISISEINNSSNAENEISKAIIRSMIYDNETTEEDSAYFVDNWKTIDINATTGGVLGIGDSYKYSLNFFMLIVLAIVTIFLLFFVAIQMSRRVMEIALYKIIGPFCCTSLTNNGRAFETWCKSSMGLFLITVVQFVSIGLLLAMFSTAFTSNGNLTGIFLIIGALLFIINTPTIINSLLGQQSGMMSAYGDMQSMMALGFGTAHGLAVAKAGMMSTLSVGANVVGQGRNILGRGVSGISNMLSKDSSLDDTQLDKVKEMLAHHDSYGAYRQVNSFLHENNNNSGTPTKINNVNRMQYNPIRNQYLNNSSLNANNRLDVDKK